MKAFRRPAHPLAPPLVATVHVAALGRWLRVSGRLCAAAAAALLASLLVLEAAWTFRPDWVQGWPALLPALAAWVFLQMTALAAIATGLSRLLETRWAP